MKASLSFFAGETACSNKSAIAWLLRFKGFLVTSLPYHQFSNSACFAQFNRTCCQQSCASVLVLLAGKFQQAGTTQHPFCLLWIAHPWLN